MPAFNLGIARARLGLTLEEFAERSGVPLDVLRVMDGGGRVKKWYERLARHAVWRLDAERQLERAGLPECGELQDLLAALPASPSIKDLEALDRHCDACPVCRAREAYVTQYVGPAPKLAPAWLDLFAPVARAPRPVHTAMMGAFMIGVLVAVPILGMLVAAVIGANAVFVLYAALLLAVAVIGGGAGGLAYGLVMGTARPRGPRNYAASIIGVWTYLAATLGILAAAAWLRIGDEDVGEVLDVVRDPLGVGIGAVLGTIFGIGLAYNIAKSDRENALPISTYGQEAQPGFRARWKSRLTWVLLGASVLLVAIRLVNGDRSADDPEPAIPTELADLERFVEQNPQNAPALFALSWTLGSQRRFEEALAAAQRAVRLEPDSARYHDALARALASLGRWEEAWQSEETAATLAPDEPPVWGFLGLTAFYANQIERSHEAFTRVLSLDSTYLTGDRRAPEREVWETVREMEWQR